MAEIEVTPRDEHSAITSDDFDRRAADRLMSVPSSHVLIALGCRGCAHRVCIDVDASNGNANEVFTQATQALDGFGVAAHVVSHRNSKAITADCPDSDECRENNQLGLELLEDAARLREKPAPVVYRSSSDTWWSDFDRNW